MHKATQIEPAVSVIIPAYQVTQYIRETLESVFAQNFRNFEVIVVNDGCPDTEALENVLVPYRDRIIYIRQQNGGVSSARNTGLRTARGKWVAFLDGDDAWLTGYLEGQLEVTRTDPTVDVVFPDGLFFGKTALAGRRTMEFSPADGEISFLRVLSGEVTVGYCALVRREILAQTGLFDTSLRGSEDFHLWLRILRVGGRIVAQNTPLYLYRRRDESLTANEVWMTTQILESLRLTEQAIDLSSAERDALEQHRRKLQAQLGRTLGKQALQSRQWEEAADHFIQVQQYAPSGKTRLVVMLLKLCPRLLYSFFSWRERRHHTRFALEHS